MSAPTNPRPHAQATAQATNTLRLTEALIACRSVTPADGGCRDLLTAVLEPAGFVCEAIDAGPEGARVSNLWAVHDSGQPGPTLVFAGHTDVVPTGPVERWSSDPFVPTHRDGRVYGRGAADMKTAVAAMTLACAAHATDCPDHPGRIALLITSDEEGPALHGTRHVVEVLRARGEPLDACIVGEPTSVERLGDMAKNGRRGSLSGRLTVQGVQGHVAYPQLARNPLHELAPALAELVAARWDPDEPDAPGEPGLNGDASESPFPPTGFQISNIHAGTGAFNVIPGELVLDFNFRFSTAVTPDQLKQRVGQILQRHRVEHRIDWTLGGVPFLTAPGTLSAALQDAVEAVCGQRPVLSTTGGTSDGRFIATLCPQVIEFGVVNASIHQVDEWVDVDAVEPLQQVYRQTLERFLK